MKYFLLGFIKVYQMTPGPWHNMCRHTPTCSNYGIEAIMTHGSLKGTILTIKRILNMKKKGLWENVKGNCMEKSKNSKRT